MNCLPNKQGCSKPKFNSLRTKSVFSLHGNYATFMASQLSAIPFAKHQRSPPPLRKNDKPRSAPARRPSLVLLTQILIWWGANNLFAIDAQTLLTKHPFPTFIDLTLVQLLLGLFLSALLHRFRNPTSSSQSLRRTAVPHSRPLILAGLVHLLGTMFTNASYRAIGAASTLVWKLSEPIATVALRKFVLASRALLPP